MYITHVSKSLFSGSPILCNSKENSLKLRLIKKTRDIEDILDIIADLLIITDSKNIILKINSTTWKSLLGYRPKDVLEKNFVDFLHPDDILNIANIQENIFLQEKELYRNKIRTKTGDYKDIEWKSILHNNRIISIGRDITETLKNEMEIKYLSYYDQLTGIYNRSFFEEEFKRLNNDRQLPLAVIMGDTNGLKIINDVFGHTIGDNVLISTAKVLKASCRKEDIVARWGGDEFAILLPNTSSNIVEEIIHRIKEQFKSESLDLNYINISLGYAVKENMEQNMEKILIAAEDNMYENKLKEGKNVRNAIILSMINYLYDSNIEIRHHINRLKEYSLAIGKVLNLSKKDLISLDLLCELHDIGQISINKELLNKISTLTDEEFIKIKKHPETGYRIAKSIPELTHMADYILYHHEYWDGTGYPFNLKGEDIPLINRIFSVIDAYDSLTTDKPYRQAYNKDDAIHYLKENSGKQFDPEIIDIFLDIVKTKD